MYIYIHIMIYYVYIYTNYIHNIWNVSMEKPQVCTTNVPSGQPHVVVRHQASASPHFARTATVLHSKNPSSLGFWGQVPKYKVLAAMAIMVILKDDFAAELGRKTDSRPKNAENSSPIIWLKMDPFRQIRIIPGWRKASWHPDWPQPV